MTITPRAIHQVAATAAFGIIGIALFDAVTHGITGHTSEFADDSGAPWLADLGNALHGLAYLTAAAALWQHRVRIDAVGRVARAAYWVVLSSVAVLAVAFLFVMPLLDLSNLPTLVSVGATGAFAGMLLGGPVLGVALLRRDEMRPGNVLLASMVPVLALTILVGLAAPAWAHPAYLETVSALGLALLGYRAAGRDAAVDGATSGAVAA